MSCRLQSARGCKRGLSPVSQTHMGLLYHFSFSLSHTHTYTHTQRHTQRQSMEFEMPICQCLGPVFVLYTTYVISFFLTKTLLFLKLFYLVHHLGVLGCKACQPLHLEQYCSQCKCPVFSLWDGFPVKLILTIWGAFYHSSLFQRIMFRVSDGPTTVFPASSSLNK